MRFVKHKFMANRETPIHVAIIMDGNGRWAQERGLSRVHGHAQGVESVRKAVKAALKNGVRYLTIYAFSTENWGRPQSEVETLMEMLCENTLREAPVLDKEGVAMKFIGDRSVLKQSVREAMEQSEQITAHNNKLTLIIAVNYSAKWEITEMVKTLSKKVSQGEIDTEQITQEMIDQYLTTHGIPDPDLLIRTSGECRLSNFLLWQLAYSELYFSQTLWPDFDEQHFEQALEEYKKRDRRYGLVTSTNAN